MNRTVTLQGSLTGPIWWPSGHNAQLPITLDLTAAAARDVSKSGMVAAIKAAVDGAGDFQSAKLTADSIVVIEHRDSTLHGWQGRGRVVEVTDLPSLAEHVDPETFTYSWEDA